MGLCFAASPLAPRANAQALAADIPGAGTALHAAVAPESLAVAPLAEPAPESAASWPAWPPSQGGLPGLQKEDLSKPLTSKQKFTRAMVQTVFPGIVGAALAAGFGMAVDTRLDRDYGMGGRGFLRRWASAFGENGVGIFVGDFAMASALHQDPRYHPEKKRGFFRRLGHAVSAVVVIPSDTGQLEFNASHLTGLVVGAGASTAWHHSSDRRATFFGERVGYQLAVSAGYNIVSEFFFFRKEPRQ